MGNAGPIGKPKRRKPRKRNPKYVKNPQENSSGYVFYRTFLILQHKSRASKVVNEELLLTAWHVGGYVSAKLKSEEWGSKVVTQLSEYIRSQRPDIKGYSRRSIYNMVMFYEEYSSETFASTVEKYLNSEFVQSLPAQITTTSITPISSFVSLSSIPHR